MKCAIVKASFLGGLRSWAVGDVLADEKALDAAVARAEVNLRAAITRLRRAREARREALAREASLVASGDVVIVARSQGVT